MTTSFFEPPRGIDGAIMLGGLPAGELARSYGTPLVVIDGEILGARIAEYTRLGARLGIGVAYAAKAFLAVGLVARLRKTPLLLDVCSLGELLTAEAAQFPAHRIYLHGCGKTTEELEAVADGRVGRIVVDGFDELDRLAALSRVERCVDVVLRVNSGIEAHTHEFVRTGGENTKFGFALEEIEMAFDRVVREPALRLVGVHAHVGSQIVDAEPFIANLEILLRLYLRARSLGIATMRDVMIGGGFGVAMRPNELDAALDVEATLTAIARRAATLIAEAGVEPPAISIEPGRALVAEAGTTLYRVVAVKQQGRRRFVIVDGGMTDNPRPALYGSYHHPELASRISTEPLVAMTICGRACENDQLVEAELAADLAPGDIVAVRMTGAYTYSMASNYNRFVRPAVVLSERGEHRLLIRRESHDDVLRNDVR